MDKLIIKSSLNLKVDLPQFMKTRIYNYFNVNTLNRISKIDGTNLVLTGTSDDIAKANNYINIYSNPQETMWKKIHEDLVLVFKSDSFIAKLERQYPIVLSLIEEKQMVVIYGSSLVTNIISSLIDQMKNDIHAETSVSSELILHTAQTFIALCKKHHLELLEMQSISSSAKFAIVKMLNQEEDVSIQRIESSSRRHINSPVERITISHQEGEEDDDATTSSCVAENDKMDTSDVIITQVVYDNSHLAERNQIPPSPDVIITAVQNMSKDRHGEKQKRGIPCVRSSSSLNDSKKIVYSFSPANINNVNIITSLNAIRKHLIAFENNSDKLGTSDRLRHVIIDGSNVAYHHGRNINFSVYGIILAVKYFFQRGHRKITVLIPHFRRGEDMYVLDTLQNWGLLNYTPSRFVNNVRQVCYDDRMLVQLACEVDGVLVSNDQYRDIMKESQKFKSIIEKRLLMYLFVDDTFMVPEDPHGLGGPSLSQLLSK